jgi:hypothetical protein
VQNRLPDRLAKEAEPQVAPVKLEDVSPIEFLEDKTKGIGVPRATDAAAGAVVLIMQPAGRMPTWPAAVHAAGFLSSPQGKM